MNARGVVPKGVSRRSVDLVLARSIAFFGVVLYGLALPDVLTQIPIRTFGWDAVFVGSIPASMIWAMLVGRNGPWRRISTGTAATLMILGFLLWHLGVIGAGTPAMSRPWSWGFPGIGIALAARAWRLRTAMLYATLFCLLIFLVPATSAGNTRSWYESAQDALLSVVMAVVILTPIEALGRAATASDRAAEEAIRETTAAALAGAIRAERARLDGLVHDTVLSALVVAAQARSTEVFEAAARAAQSSLDQLDGLQSTDDEQAPIGAEELMSRLRAATASYRSRVIVDGGQPTITIPLAASRALVQATMEAVRNSAIHARCGSTVTVRLTRGPAPQATGVHIEIADSGPGFNPDSVPAQRLGIRVSIIQRMQDISGKAVISSSIGSGTRVRLTWATGGKA